jgi:hypothetical protein
VSVASWDSQVRRLAHRGVVTDTIERFREIRRTAEIGSPPRQIYTDGRPLPKNLDPTWMGYSIGKW